MRPINLWASALALALCLPAVQAQSNSSSPSLPGPGFPLIKTAAQVKSACDSGLQAAQQRVKQLEARKLDLHWLSAFDDYVAFVEDTQGPIDFLQHVHPDKALRDAAQDCAMRWAEFASGVNQNEKLYKALKRVPTPDAIDREAQRNALGGFEDSGVALPVQKRQRAKQILDKLAALDQQFNRNIRDAAVRVAFSEAELKGVPESVWKNAPRNAEGQVLLGVDNPSVGPVMQTAVDAAARERMWRAKTNEGGTANLQLLAQIAELRHEYAQLFGYGNYVDFNLRRRMAHNAATAWKFLDEVKGAVTERDKQDVEQLREAKAAHLAQALAETKLERWDASFYAERVRQARYSVDQEAFRAYFPAEHALPFALRIIEQLMGVRYTRLPAETWHPEVQAFAVSDAGSGKPLATLYVDLFPREGKYNHAAVWPLRSSATRIGRAPMAALVVNFNRQGLTLDEMEVLLHELGHAVHNNLSTTRYAMQGGTSVMLDFVEAPSQMLEDWVYDGRVLALMQQVCADCKPIPAELLAKAVAAREFAKGSRFGRQHLYASYDLALHGPKVPDPLALWARMEGETPLGYVAGTQFPAGFAHIAGGYGSGYYGYLWSLVVAMDLRTAFAADKLDPATGQAYRSKVLAQGSQKPAAELVRDFLGRESRTQAFFDYLKR